MNWENRLRYCDFQFYRAVDDNEGKETKNEVRRNGWMKIVRKVKVDLGVWNRVVSQGENGLYDDDKKLVSSF